MEDSDLTPFFIDSATREKLDFLTDLYVERYTCAWDITDYNDPEFYNQHKILVDRQIEEYLSYADSDLLTALLVDSDSNLRITNAMNSGPGLPPPPIPDGI